MLQCEFAEVLRDTHTIYRRQTYMCCSVLQCSVLQCAAVCCSVLQRDAVCCSVLQYEHAEVLRDAPAIYRRQTCMCCSVLQCSVLQCVAVCCSVLQCVAVCCSVLQYEHAEVLRDTPAI